MGENLNLMQALYITVSSMVMVFLILLLISGVLSVFKSIFKSETVVKTQPINENKSSIIEENNLEVDENEKIIVALVASIAAGEGIPNPNLHIKRITRIS